MTGPLGHHVRGRSGGGRWKSEAGLQGLWEPESMTVSAGWAPVWLFSLIPESACYSMGHPERLAQARAWGHSYTQSEPHFPVTLCLSQHMEALPFWLSGLDSCPVSHGDACFMEDSTWLDFKIGHSPEHPVGPWLPCSPSSNFPLTISSWPPESQAW
jgi:hypothetical protein